MAMGWKLNSVMFDLDGTLTDSGEGIMNSARYALARLGIEEDDPARLRRFIGPPLKESFRDFYGVEESMLDQAVHWYRERYVPVGMFENRLYAGIVPMLDTLTGMGLRLFIATSKPQPMAVRIAGHFGIVGYFQAIVGASMDETRARKGEIIRHLIDTRLDGSNRNLVMVGDRIHDVEGAGLCGIPAVGVAWGYGSRDELMRGGAAAIADTPDELCAIMESGL